MDSVDIFISGGGIAGLVAAAGFSEAGFSVCLADPAPPPGAPSDAGADLRSTAYLRPGAALMDAAGVWEALRPLATPLDTLRVVDTQGWPPALKTSRAFQSGDLGDGPFGWNLPNWRTRALLAQRIAARDGVDLRWGTGFSQMLPREAEALVTLTDGTRLRARLVIAADGRGSPVREAAGIGARTWTYGQKALALTVAHEQPHENVSIEIYNQGGAFTLVPAADHDGSPASGVVWMNDGPRALELAALDADALGAEMTLRSCNLLGAITPLERAQPWPVITRVADRLTARRLALVAEAAHVLPPIGAQGLNTSLQDIAALLELAKADPRGLGGKAMLAAYAARRGKDIALRARAIDGFNRICKSGALPVQALRAAGLKAVHDIAPLRRAVMRAGMGPPGPAGPADQAS